MAERFIQEEQTAQGKPVSETDPLSVQEIETPQRQEQDIDILSASDSETMKALEEPIPSQSPLEIKIEEWTKEPEGNRYKELRAEILKNTSQEMRDIAEHILSNDEHPLKSWMLVYKLQTLKNISSTELTSIIEEIIEVPREKRPHASSIFLQLASRSNCPDISSVTSSFILNNLEKPEVFALACISNSEEVLQATRDHLVLHATKDNMPSDLSPLAAANLIYRAHTGDENAIDCLLILCNAPELNFRNVYKPLKISEEKFRTGGEELLWLIQHEEPETVASRISILQNELQDSPNSLSAHALTHYTRTRNLGIHFPNRFSNETVTKLLEMRTSPIPEDMHHAAIVYPRTDSNGAYYNTQLIETLLERGYHVSFTEASSDMYREESVVMGLKTLTRLDTKDERPADLIVLAGHGFQDHFQLTRSRKNMTRYKSDRAMFDTKDEPSLLQSGVARTLAPNGKILARSCSLGEGMDEADNIANMLRRVFPQAAEHGIFTPVAPFNRIHLEFSPTSSEIEDAHFFHDSKKIDSYRAEIRPASRNLVASHSQLSPFATS